MLALTAQFIRSHRPTRDQVVWDQLPGFGVRFRPSGRVTYVVQYRAGGRSHRRTLGPVSAMTLTAARAQARRLLAQPLVQLGEKTVQDLIHLYLERHGPKKKAASLAQDRRLLNRFVIPALGHLPIQSVNGEMADLHRGLATTPYQANRVLALCSMMFGLAEAWGLRGPGTNPCAHIRRFREQGRQRYLSKAEAGRLGQALIRAEAQGLNRWGLLAIKLLLLTGCRRHEIETLCWDQVDWSGALQLQDSKTGPRRVVVGRAVVKLLTAVQATTTGPYVCGGARPFRGLFKVWARVRAMAGLQDVRLHDLRHTYAATAAGLGVGLPVIGGLLGHAGPRTTAGYAHLAPGPLAEAADQISQELRKSVDWGTV